MAPKVGDISAATIAPETVRCTENLICPTNSFSLVNGWYKIRYWLVRQSSTPVAIPFSFPFLGGRNALEVAIMLVILGAGLYVTIISGSTGSGSIASWIAGMGVLLGLRNNPLTLLFGISFERALFWHKIVCMSAIVFAIAHGCLAGSSGSGITLICLMGGTSLFYLAKYVSFELFYLVHVAFLAGIAAVAFIHHASTFGICVIIWAFDVAVRYLLLGRRVEATAVVLPAGVVRLTFPKPFQYTAGQFVFVMIPKLSAYQYHPFTISSAPHEDSISLHIRTLGDWTNALSNLVLKESADNLDAGIPLTVYLEGPYGLSSVDLTNPMYKVILLVSGGIGVTPAQSVFNDIVEKHSTNQTSALRKCIFVWSVKDRALVDSLDVATATTDVEKQLKPVRDLPKSFQPDLIRISTLDGGVASSVATTPEVELQQMPPASIKVTNSTIADPSIFHCEYYLTSVRSAAEQAAANILPSQQSYMKFGRPDLGRLFTEVTELCERESVARVAVVTCGPLPMTEEVQKLCGAHRSGKVKFDVHVEEFSF